MESEPQIEVPNDLSALEAVERQEAIAKLQPRRIRAARFFVKLFEDVIQGKGGSFGAGH